MTETMHHDYDSAAIEAAAQNFWKANDCFKATETSERPKFYCLSMFPYPSGHLHMGHVRNYTIGDVISRYQRHRGHHVLQPIGADAFGLPAENAALKHGTAPSTWTRNNIDALREQLQPLGLGYDWSRELVTCDPSYYRWEQWFFIQLYNRGLVYKKKAIVNWDPIDQTVLANEQVIDGCGWRSGAPVEQREIAQWFLKITAYADALLDDLDTLDGWPEQVKTMQRHWIGRSEGLNIDFEIEGYAQPLKVYTTRPDTLFGVSYVAIAAQHPLVTQLPASPSLTNFLNRCRQQSTAEANLETAEKIGFATDLIAIHPLTGAKVPIWIANFVLMSYGTGAVMAVPGHDQRDYDFAKQYNLPITQVITVTDGDDVTQQAITEKGRLIHSECFSGMTSTEAFDAIATALGDRAERQIRYRLRDWGISRQRYWGTPIPMIVCKNCGDVPVPETDLPVVLPEGITLNEPASPLKKDPKFYQTICPRCQKPAERETDTFDTFVESSWYYARYTCTDQDQQMLDQRADYWLPVDHYIGGIEHAVMHLLYARFFHKLMRDLDLIHSDEPFKRLLTQGMVLKDGSKMSKSKGNTVDPSTLLKRYGADTVRLFIMFAAPPEQSLEWSDSGVDGAHRFLRRVWQCAVTERATLSLALPQIDQTILTIAEQQARYTTQYIFQKINVDYERLHFNTVVSGAMKLFNHLQDTLLALATTEQGKQLANEAFYLLIHTLAPITPHLCHALWTEFSTNTTPLLDSPWPEVDPYALQMQQVTLVVQINGKRRGTIHVPSDADLDTVRAAVTADPDLGKFIKAPIRKIIVVPNRLVNVVT